MDVVKFMPQHLMKVKTREMVHVLPGLPDLVTRAELYAAKGPAMSLFDQHGQLIACTGALMIHEYFGEAWVITTPLVEDRKNHLGFHRFALKGIEILFDVYKIKRLQASVKLNWTKAVQWASRLGFVSEGVMPAFAPDGSDYIRMAIVRNNNG